MGQTVPQVTHFIGMNMFGATVPQINEVAVLGHNFYNCLGTLQFLQQLSFTFRGQYNNLVPLVVGPLRQINTLQLQLSSENTDNGLILTRKIIRRRLSRKCHTHISKQYELH